MAMIPVTVAIRSLLSDSHSGSVRTKTSDERERRGRRPSARSGIDRSSVGIGRTSRAACQDDTAWSSTRLPRAARLEQQADHDDRRTAPGTRRGRGRCRTRSPARRCRARSRPPRCAGSCPCGPSTTAASARTSTVTPSALPIGKLDDAGPQEDGDEGEHRRDHPHGRLDPPDRDAEGGGAVGALGRRLGSRSRSACTGGTAPGAPSTSGTTMNTIRSLSSKKTPPISTLTSKGGLSSRPTDVLEPEPARHEQREGGQQLRDADRRDGEDEARRAAEPVDERALDDEAEEDGRDQARRRSRPGRGGRSSSRARRRARPWRPAGSRRWREPRRGRPGRS